MDKTLTIIGVLVLVVAGIWLLGQVPVSDQGNESTQEGPVSQVQDTSTGDEVGKVVFSVTDAAADMENVSEVTMNVDGLAVHSEADGWTQLEVESQEFNLLELRDSGEFRLLSEADVAAGVYNQVRLSVGSVVVETTDGAQAQARLPSGVLRLQGEVEVSDGEASSVSLDFLADQSLHVTGNGEYIFAPVVQMESRSSAEVTVGSNGSVVVRGGNVRADVTIGMDFEGNVGVGVRASSNANVEINNGVINVDVGSSAEGQSQGEAQGQQDESGDEGDGQGAEGEGSVEGSATSGGAGVNVDGSAGVDVETQ